MSTAESRDEVIELRPKRAWLAASVAVLGYFCVVAFSTDDVFVLVWIGAAAAVTAITARWLIRVEDGVLYRRGVFVWHAPVDLRALASVSLTRKWFGRPPYKHLELGVSDMEGNWLHLQLRWWSDTTALLSMLADSLVVTKDGSNEREWQIRMDDETNRRLAGYLSPPAWRRDAPRGI